MAGVLYDADNVVVGEAYLFLKPWTKLTPPVIIPDVTPLFDVVAYETAGWKGTGATHEGFRANVDTSTTTVTIEEQSTPVGEYVESKGVTFEAALAEDTLGSMQLSWAGGVITVAAPTAALPGTSKMVLTDTIKYWAAILEMRNQFGLARRIFIPKASLTGSGETAFRRAADKRTYPIRVASVCKPTDIQIVDITAPKTA